MLWLLDAVVRDAVTSRAPARRSAAAGGRHEALVEAAKLVLARRVSGPLPLGELAREVGSSPYHLCRVFRAVTGATVIGSAARVWRDCPVT